MLPLFTPSRKETSEAGIYIDAKSGLGKVKEKGFSLVETELLLKQHSPSLIVVELLSIAGFSTLGFCGRMDLVLVSLAASFVFIFLGSPKSLHWSCFAPFKILSLLFPLLLSPPLWIKTFSPYVAGVSEIIRRRSFCH